MFYVGTSDADARTPEVALAPPPSTPCLPRLRLKNHKNIIEVEALSDIAGSEGIVMELALCDLFQASVGQSETRFTLSQLIG